MHESLNRDGMRAIGFLGQWEIDFTTMRVRGNRRVGPVFGIISNKMREGTSLSECDKAYLPEDLELIKRNRKSMIGRPGRYVLQYSLKGFHGSGITPVFSLASVETDRFGLLKRASGILVENKACHLPAANDTSSREDALRNLKRAISDVEHLGMSYQSDMLRVIYKQVAQNR